MTTATITEQRIAATVTETTIAATVTETTIAATIGNAPGAQGPAGPGVPSGGTTGQVPRKASTTDYDTAWDTLDAADVGADAAGTAAAAVATEAAARASADSTHAALTTTAHGGIVASSDARLSDARTPTAHAASHAAAGGDPLTLAQSQITGLATALTGKEPSLGNPASDGYVLSSTALGARSWIAAPGSPFIAANDADVPLISRGHSAGQTGNLQEWQASDLSVLAKVDKGGDIYGKYLIAAEGAPLFVFAPYFALERLISVVHTWSAPQIDSTPAQYIGAHIDVTYQDTIDGSSNPTALIGIIGSAYTPDSLGAPQDTFGLNFIIYNESSHTTNSLIGANLKAYASGSGVIDVVAGFKGTVDNYGSYKQVYGAGAVISELNFSEYGGFQTLIGIDVHTPDMYNVDAYYAIRSSYGEVLHQAGGATVTPLVLQGAASQSADLLRLLDSDGSSILHRINKDGYLVINRHSAPADGDLAAGDLALWLDQTNGAAKLKIKAKSANGTVVSGEVALA